MSYASDISMSLATAAHAGTSFVSEKRAEQHRSEYSETLTEDYETFRKHAVQGGTLELLEEEFSQYRAGYRHHYSAWLGAKSRCISVMITGPSNFPGRRNAKRNETEHRRCEDLIEFRKRAIQAVIRRLRPDLRPIMSGDGNAVERLEEKITKAEAEQGQMRAANAAIRKHKKAGAEAQTRALVELGFALPIAEQLLKPDFCGRIGFADYQLTNNNANIRRMKERVAHVAEQKTTQNSEVEGELARLEDAPAENRIRLYFPGKPSAEVRTSLKTGGFRWTPSLGCWQAYRNQWNLDKARVFAGVKEAA